MIALIDTDSYCYASAAMAEGQSDLVAKWNLNKMIESTLNELNTQDFQCYITGDNNFRQRIYPEYKANRIGMKRPEYLQQCKQHAIDEWKAIKSDGCEADDLLGIHQMRDENTIIVSIDKDLDMIPGYHYNPRKKIEYIVSPLQGISFFYYQLLVGDTADNIKGVKGIGPKKAANYTADCESESDLYEVVRGLYPSPEELEMNAACLWIWRKPDDIWKIETHAPQ